MTKKLLVCRCNTVSEREVLRCIREGATSLEAVEQACEAGTGCGSCRAAICSLLEREARKRSDKRQIPIELLQLSLFAKERSDF